MVVLLLPMRMMMLLLHRGGGGGGANGVVIRQRQAAAAAGSRGEGKHWHRATRQNGHWLVVFGGSSNNVGVDRWWFLVNLVPGRELVVRGAAVEGQPTGVGRGGARVTGAAFQALVQHPGPVAGL